MLPAAAAVCSRRRLDRFYGVRQVSVAVIQSMEYVVKNLGFPARFTMDYGSGVTLGNGVTFGRQVSDNDDTTEIASDITISTV